MAGLGGLIYGIDVGVIAAAFCFFVSIPVICASTFTRSVSLS